MQVLAFIAHYCCGGGSLFPAVGRSTTLDPFCQQVGASVGTQPSSALQFFGYMGRKETERVTHTHTHTMCDFLWFLYVWVCDSGSFFEFDEMG
jgi:hypothetical protein